MRIELAYDTDGLEVELPDANVKAVLRHRPAPPLADPAGAVRAALANPIGTRPLSVLAAGRKSACVLICDHTRPAPDRIMLPPLLSAIEAAGVERDKISILVATGLHRPSTPAELARMVGPDVLARYRVENHVARNRDDHVFCCTTSAGTKAQIDRRFLAADLKIATGFVEPHLMAGFGGGRKLVGVGIASADTICSLHSPRVLENPNTRGGNLAKNLLHAEATEIARSAGLEFILHATLDEQKRPTAFFAGDFEAAFEAAVADLRPQIAAKLDRPCDIAVTSGGGFPLDASYYQTVKGIAAAAPAVRKGGTILVASGCREGLGSNEFCHTLTKFQNFNQFRSAILDPHKPYFQVDQWQHEQISQIREKAAVVLAQSMLTSADRKALWIPSADRFTDALAEALAHHGRSATIAVLPKGPYVMVDCAYETADQRRLRNRRNHR